MEKISLHSQVEFVNTKYRISDWFFSVRSVVDFEFSNSAFILACFSLFFNLSSIYRLFAPPGKNKNFLTRKVISLHMKN